MLCDSLLKLYCSDQPETLQVNSKYTTASEYVHLKKVKKVQACLHKNFKVEVNYDPQGAFWWEPKSHISMSSYIEDIIKIKHLNGNTHPDRQTDLSF